MVGCDFQSMSHPRVAIITGGGRGIGAAAAKLAAARGYAVCVNYRQNHEAASRVVADIEAAGGRAVAIAADVSVESEIVRLFEAATAALGPVTALVNSAGIIETQMRVEQMDAGRLQRVFAANVFGPFLCAREAVRRMSSKHGGQGGSIVNVSSKASVYGSPHEYVDYAATKGALDTMTIGLAKEVAGEGIRVNAVRPGIIDTEIHATRPPGQVEKMRQAIPMARLGTVDEIAATILWLASDEASYVTAALLDARGGI